MTRQKTFLIIQSLLHALTAGLLAAGARCLYFDGAAKQAEGDLFYYMFIRERAGTKLLQGRCHLLRPGAADLRKAGDVV